MSDATKLRRENARLRKTLEFYADPETYFAIAFLPDPPCGDFVKDFEPITKGVIKTWRPGKRARASLSKP